MHKMLALLVRLVYNMCVSKKETKEYPMTNNEETRSKLAKEVVETMTLEDLTSFVMQRLEQDYEKDSDLFEEDMEVYLPQEAGIFQNPFEVE